MNIMLNSFCIFSSAYHRTIKKARFIFHFKVVLGLIAYNTAMKTKRGDTQCDLKNMFSIGFGGPH